jgi:SAM-dependent methyltransferase
MRSPIAHSQGQQEMDPTKFRERGKRFNDADVAGCYAFRPAYPRALFDAVLKRAPGRAKLLDLGTGNGKIAGALADEFDEVTAVDPSPSMLGEARRLWRGHRNISWTCDAGETVPLAGPYDLVTAGASIHWMKPNIVFPRLAGTLAPAGRIAIIVGDFPHDPPWQTAWADFVERWTVRLGDAYAPERWHTGYEAHESWMSIEFREPFLHEVSQTIPDFIECQHSRASWTRHALGPANAEAFDAELLDLLTPFATDGHLSYRVITNLTLGTARRSAIGTS